MSHTGSRAASNTTVCLSPHCWRKKYTRRKKYQKKKHRRLCIQQWKCTTNRQDKSAYNWSGRGKRWCLAMPHNTNPTQTLNFACGFRKKCQFAQNCGSRNLKTIYQVWNVLSFVKGSWDASLNPTPYQFEKHACTMHMCHACKQNNWRVMSRVGWWLWLKALADNVVHLCIATVTYRKSTPNKR